MLSEIDLDHYYKEQFIIDELCHICGKNKMCINDMGTDLESPCFICFDCDTKRYNEENEYEQKEQQHDIDKDISISNLVLSTMGLE